MSQKNLGVNSLKFCPNVVIFARILIFYYFTNMKKNLFKFLCLDEVDKSKTRNLYGSLSQSEPLGSVRRNS